MYGKRLATLRKEMKMSQTVLADKLNISQQTLHNYEHEKAEPSFQIMCSFADFFGVSLDYLLGRTDTRSFGTPSTQYQLKADIASGEAALDGKISPNTDESATRTQIISILQEFGLIPNK